MQECSRMRSFYIYVGRTELYEPLTVRTGLEEDIRSVRFGKVYKLSLRKTLDGDVKPSAIGTEYWGAGSQPI